MKHSDNLPMVTTIKERCRVCYTCVRECPAKAIRIADGQAEVIEKRCIGCGNCVKVCSQHAKKVLNAIDETRDLLAGDAPVAAILAPTFPAEFDTCTEDQVVGMIKALGFDYVYEVAFGADLVSKRYVELIRDNPGGRYVATSCPGIIGFVERYLPGVVDKLAPIVSPMIAMARVAHHIHGDKLKVVFVGPCIAKKGEAASENVAGEVDTALTFQELHAMLAADGIQKDKVEESDFDPPRAGKGALFPISRGMLQASGLLEDLMVANIIAADGRTNFVDALNEFESGGMECRLLEVLCCTGCIMGAGMTCETPLFRRRAHVSRHVRDRINKLDWDKWEEDLEEYSDLDLSRIFTARDQRNRPPSEDELRTIMERMGKFESEDELNCGACGYSTCVEHAIAIYKGRAESEMCLPFTIEQLRHTVKELASTQEALVNSEKLASMGQLAAGIAHEVNNPLGVVLMYAHLMMEDCPQGSEQLEDLIEIVQHADRCKKIVAGLLNFARQNKVDRRKTDVQDMLDKLVKSLTIPKNVKLVMEHNLSDPFAEIDQDQIVQVVTNLCNNGIAAMHDCEKGLLKVSTEDDENWVRILVSDTGTGISPEHLKKIFDPFFTTKEVGEGTGLGLAVTYGIIKMHQGDIQVESNADPEKGPTGTTFRLVLPRIKQEPEDGEESGESPQATLQ
ncbi:MAG: [Fe-Fe] hydrogenase large subunit C-terminal domain-containing protein [Candidatus Sumerlaeia bacterium]